jgi:hypothetical protein
MSDLQFFVAIFGFGLLPILHILFCRSPPKESAGGKAPTGDVEAGSSGSAPELDKGDQAYLLKHGDEIQEGLGAALKEVINQKSASPLEAIGKLLAPQSSSATAATVEGTSAEMSMEDKIDELRSSKYFAGKSTDALRQLLQANGGDVKLTHAACRELM